MNVGRRLKRWFFTGVLVAGPLSVSLFLLAWLVGRVDRILSPAAVSLVGHDIPGVGLATALLLIMGAGWLGSNVIGQQVFEAVEELVFRVPVLSWVYRTVKQLAEVFSPGGRAPFRSVVLVEYPREGVFQLGFVTATLPHERDGKAGTLTSVYVPTNHLYIGDVLLVPSERLHKTEMTLQEGIQFFLSAGTSTPPALKTTSGGKTEGPAA